GTSIRAAMAARFFGCRRATAAAGPTCPPSRNRQPPPLHFDPMNTTDSRGAPPLAHAPRLAGDLAIWIFILAELLAFGVFFAAYAFTRANNVELFDAEQAALSRNAGALNTVLLLTAGYFVVRAVQAAERAADRIAGHWLAGAIACGTGFLAVKLFEYAHAFEADISLSSSPFHMFYLSLTFFHFMHVILGLVILIAL